MAQQISTHTPSQQLLLLKMITKFIFTRKHRTIISTELQLWLLLNESFFSSSEHNAKYLEEEEEWAGKRIARRVNEWMNVWLKTSGFFSIRWNITIIFSIYSSVWGENHQSFSALRAANYKWVRWRKFYILLHKKASSPFLLLLLHKLFFILLILSIYNNSSSRRLNGWKEEGKFLFNASSAMPKL